MRRTGSSTAGVDVVIVNWNGRRWLPRCFEALYRSTIPLRVILVDNASTDESVPYTRSMWPAVEVIEAGGNCGYAAGANLGLTRMRSRYALVMNADVLVEPEYLQRLRDRLDADARIGAAQGKLYRISAADFDAGTPTAQTLDSAGHVIRRSRMVIDRGQGEQDLGQYDRETSVFSVCGGAVFLRAAMLPDIAVGGEFFAEAFFAYKEDIDLCWRARLRGWDIRYIPAAVAHHVRALPLGGAGWRALGPAARRHSWKNHYLLMLRNDRASDLLRALPFVASWECARLAHALLRDPAVIPAYASAMSAVRSALRARRQIQASRCVSGSELRRWFGTQPGSVMEESVEVPQPAAR